MKDILVFVVAVVLVLSLLPIVMGLYTAAFYISLIFLFIGIVLFWIRNSR